MDWTGVGWGGEGSAAWEGQRTNTQTYRSSVAKEDARLWGGRVQTRCWQWVMFTFLPPNLFQGVAAHLPPPTGHIKLRNTFCRLSSLAGRQSTRGRCLCRRPSPPCVSDRLDNICNHQLLRLWPPANSKSGNRSPHGDTSSVNTNLEFHFLWIAVSPHSLCCSLSANPQWTEHVVSVNKQTFYMWASASAIKLWMCF